MLNQSAPATTGAAPFTALVLAGRRGPTDSLAQAAGCSHKALVPIGGAPMLVRVVRTLRAVQHVGKVVVSIDDPHALDSLSEIRTLVDSEVLSFSPSSHSPSASALAYFKTLPAGERLLVTTADHPLLTVEMLEYFCSTATARAADVVVGVVAASLFHAHYPTSKRSFIPLRNERLCGTNLFALCSPQAAAAAAFWDHAGQFRKRPWRLVSTFGLINLLLIAFRRLDIEAALVRASHVIGARAAVVCMPFAECAIDVDNPNDLALASHILARREGAPLAREQGHGVLHPSKVSAQGSAKS